MTTSTRDLLQKHFDTAFSAPDGIPKLRELILTLAMQGKLVEQDPKDPPARDLLKQIEEAKENGSHEGTKTRRKANDFPPIKVEEHPYQLPGSWEWVRLGELCKIVYGKGLPKSKLTDNGYKVFGANGIIGFYHEYLYEAEQLLVSCRGAYSGKPNISPPECYITSNSLVLENDWKYLNLRYLYFSLTIAKKEKIVTGSAQPQVTTTNLEPFLVPLPPLPEQQRIVAKVDQLMAQCDELEKLKRERDAKRLATHAAAIKQLTDPKLRAFVSSCEPFNFLRSHFNDLCTVKENVAELRKAILQLAVMGKLVPQDPNDPPASELLKQIEAGKKKISHEGTKTRRKPKTLPPIKPEEVPYELPKGWEWVRLGDLALSSDSGWSPQCLPHPRIEENWGVLKVSAVSWGEFRPEENKALPPNIDPRPEAEVRDGDFLLSRANTDELVARSVLVKSTPKKLMMSDKIVRFRFPENIQKQYINLANGVKHSREYYIANASGTSSSMKNVGRDVMTKLPIPLPPLPEQHRIVAKVDQLMTLCDELEQQIDASIAKRTSLLNAVMSQVS